MTIETSVGPTSAGVARDFQSSGDSAGAVSALGRTLHVDLLIDHAIVGARRRNNPASWAAIGNALDITGQAASKRARARDLPTEPLTPDRYAAIVTEAGRLTSRE